MTSSVSTHQILYEEVDESGVEPTNIVSSTEDKDNPKGYDTYRYPRLVPHIRPSSYHFIRQTLRFVVYPPIRPFI